MKTTAIRSALVLTMFIFSGILNTATAQGIEFFHGTFAEAKAKAAEENKLIFVDAYAQWCGPCKWMAANTFTDREVGKYFNENFICVKMDMEKGEGRILASAWRIKAYPTLLFFDSDGKEVNRVLGAKQKEEFIKLGEKVVKKKA
jgi:thiol:disulfide interchange protein